MCNGRVTRAHKVNAVLSTPITVCLDVFLHSTAPTSSSYILRCRRVGVFEPFIVSGVIRSRRAKPAARCEETQQAYHTEFYMFALPSYSIKLSESNVRCSGRVSI